MPNFRVRPAFDAACNLKSGFSHWPVATWRMLNWKAALLPHYLIYFPILFAWSCSGDAADSFSIAPPAACVNVQSELNRATNSTDENVRYILIDQQVNV